MRFILGIVILISVKFVINFVQWLKARWLRNRYFLSLKKDGKSFSELVASTKQLFKEADVEACIPYSQKTGYNQIVTSTINVSDNLTLNRVEIVHAALDLFDESVGVFRKRMLEAVSPIYWVKTVLYLPSCVIKYLGGNEAGIFSKTLQLLYWIFTPLFIAFRSQLYSYIVSVIERMQ